eukprot:2345107-Amphidinium_carterae.2
MQEQRQKLEEQRVENERKRKEAEVKAVELLKELQVSNHCAYRKQMRTNWVGLTSSSNALMTVFTAVEAVQSGWGGHLMKETGRLVKRKHPQDSCPTTCPPSEA